MARGALYNTDAVWNFFWFSLTLVVADWPKKGKKGNGSRENFRSSPSLENAKYEETKLCFLLFPNRTRIFNKNLLVIDAQGLRLRHLS